MSSFFEFKSILKKILIKNRNVKKVWFHSVAENGERDMEIITTIGLVAAVLSTVALLPQVIRVWKTKSVKDISMGMFMIMTTSQVTWLVYGALMGETPIITSNFIVLMQTMALLSFKAKYR
jgi:MtN3 and saliva related transmembrane protein